MITGKRTIRISALICAVFLAMIIFMSFPSRSDAGPDTLVRRTRNEAKQKKDKEEEKKEEEKKNDKGDDDNKGSSQNQPANSEGSHHYHSYRDTSYDTHFSYWSPYYQRVVDIYFNEAYAQLNEGFFYDAEEGVEYLAGEWFDLVLQFETYAVVPGEDIKIVYSVKDYDGDEVYWNKEFRPINVGSNEKTIFRAFPSSLLAENSRLYIDIILTIEGNNAYGGFWLETLPTGNEGPLRVGDVVVAAPVSGGESNPLYNLNEGNQYKLYAEYDIDYYLGDYADVQWRIYDSDGVTITEGNDYIEARAGYGYYATLFAIPDVQFSGTRDCYLDVRIESPPYLGRSITEIKVTGNGTAQAPPDSGNTGGMDSLVLEPLNEPPPPPLPGANSDENYFDFEATSIFLPYEWDASETSDGVAFTTANDIDGRFTRYDLEKASGGVPDLNNIADNFEKDIAGVKLTRQNHLANGSDVVSTSFLEMSGGSAQSISLYACYIANIQDDSFDLWVIEMTAGASDIQEIYDDLDEILDGLFIKT